MRVYLHARPDQPHQVRAMRDLRDGICASGDEIASSLNGSDVSVYWGDRAPQIARARPVLILECGYINGDSRHYAESRLRFVSCSWNAPHGLADPAPAKSPADRWRSLGIRLRKWRRRDDPRVALVLDQMPGDRAAPTHSQRETMIYEARMNFPEVWVRSHPLQTGNNVPLSVDLDECDVAVTWSSTAAVEAVLSGVPVIARGEAAIVRPVAATDFGQELYYGDRRKWAYNLAYRQYSHDELADGTAWRNIKALL